MRPLFLADENIKPNLVLGLCRRVGGIDIVRAQEVGLRSMDDPTILGWAATEGRSLIARDVKSVPTFVSHRLMAGHPVPGVFVLPRGVSDSMAIDDLSLIASATEAEEWYDHIVYLPLR